MAAQRLSQLQKWILINCFQVTIQLDRDGLQELNNARNNYNCRTCPGGHEHVKLERNCNNCTVAMCRNNHRPCPRYAFYREDVLLSYFHLRPNNSISHLERVQHFRAGPDYTKAHVTLTRSIQNLWDKELVYTWNAYGNSSHKICLTEEGVERAAALAGVNEYTIPPLLSDEECATKQAEVERQRAAILRTLGVNA